MTTKDIYYKNKYIGKLIIHKLYNGITACFVTENIKDTLSSLNAYKLNWFQICTYDDNPPYNIEGERIVVPYIDPYPKGYALEQNKNLIYWNDGYPWYWDVSNVYTKKDYNGVYDITCTLSYNLKDNTLYYQDLPDVRKNCRLNFTTKLVSLDENYDLKEILAEFQWSIKKNQYNKITIDITVF